MKVGDYVRTNFGCICKIVNINEFREPSMKYGVEANYLKDIMFIGDDDIKLVKEKPIDLIEVGDILYLEESDDIVCMFFRDIYLVKNEDNLTHIIDDIKNKKSKLISIVTKEQFESMQYKIGE